MNENEKFIGYWDRVEDRLYKIRHCLNIEGVFRQLSLYDSPIDPAQLVRAIAAGNLPMRVINGLRSDVSNYRFDYMLERAKNMVSTLIQLGNSILSALEKQDAEQISLLRASQESAILQLLQTIKQKQVDEATANIVSLNQSLLAASNRQAHYQNLINSGWNAGKITGVALMGTAIGLEAISYLAAPVYLLPTIFGLSDGGMNSGGSIQAVSAAVSGIASAFNQSASLSLTIAQYQRRAEDWKLQLQMATDDVTPITLQKKAALLSLDIASSELTSHMKSIELPG